VKYFICLAVIIYSYLPSIGQQIKVRGGFLIDSVGIGQQTRYYLAVQYPSNLNILFPDSTYDYKPFEFEKKQYYPTHTTDSISYDSAVYYLTTFEVDAVQYLALPVFVVSEKDSVIVTANTDSILLSQLVHHVPDSLSADKLPLKMNTAYQKVNYLFNYPVVIIIIGSVLIVALIVILVFGKRIAKYFRIKKLMKNHRQFSETYAAHLNLLRSAFTPGMTETTLATWKAYLEQLDPQPFTKLTTREILSVEKDEHLGINLHQVDRMIYGNDTSGAIDPLERLGDYANKKYLTKLEEVKHGK
jgi:hypothetical protein